MVRVMRLCIALWMASMVLGGCAVAHMKTADVRPGDGVGPIYLGMEMSEVRRILGEPPARKTMPTGLAFTYTSEGVSVYGDARSGVLRITCGLGFVGDVNRLRDFWGSTPEGIKVGSTRAQVIKAYGLPEDGDVLQDVNPRSHEGTLVYHARGISFRLQDDVVVRMQVYRKGGKGAAGPASMSRQGE